MHTNLTDRNELLTFLKQHGLWLNRKLGQHFLIDHTVLEQIIIAADFTGDETVLEVGPGVGTLTQALGAALPNGLVLALERDERLVRLLREEFKNSKHVKVLHQNVLDYPPQSIGVPDYRIVTNLPYQITGAFLRKFLDPDLVETPSLLVVMLQKEVVDRLIAKPGSSERGILTIVIELFGDAELVTDVPKTSFFPVPEVDSAVVKITRRDDRYKLEEKQLMLMLVKAGFSAKRRTLVNALSGGLRLEKDKVEKLVTAAGLKPLVRAEDLSLEDWAALAARIQPNYVGMLEGLGKDLWQKLGGADHYIKQERNSWDKKPTDTHPSDDR